MPITCPAESTSGPPEFPGLMGADVWKRPFRFSVSPVLWSSTLTERLVAEMIPLVTVSEPERAKALPMATTWSPTLMALELPIVTVLKSPPFNLSKATSSVSSVPSTVTG